MIIYLHVCFALPIVPINESTAGANRFSLLLESQPFHVVFFTRFFFFQRIEPESFDQAAFLMVVDGVCSTSHTRRIFINLGTVRLCWVFVHKTVSVGMLWHPFTFQQTTVLESQPNIFSIYNIHKWWPTLQSTPNLRSPWDTFCMLLLRTNCL